MNIWEYAESIGFNADYMDMVDMCIYKITEYKKNPTLPGIPVYQDGTLIGYAKRQLKSEDEE